MSTEEFIHTLSKWFGKFQKEGNPNYLLRSQNVSQRLVVIVVARSLYWLLTTQKNVRPSILTCMILTVTTTVVSPKY
jgi:hypothetical protein